MLQKLNQENPLPNQNQKESFDKYSEQYKNKINATLDEIEIKTKKPMDKIKKENIIEEISHLKTFNFKMTLLCPQII